MTCRSGAGPTEISPVNGRSCEAISNADVAMPVANRPSEMAEAIRLSQWTIAIANNAATACTNKQSHFTKFTRDWLMMMLSPCIECAFERCGDSTLRNFCAFGIGTQSKRQLHRLNK